MPGAWAVVLWPVALWPSVPRAGPHLCVNVAGGRHATALTADGKVFSWGEGDDGKLGHFSRM